MHEHPFFNFMFLAQVFIPPECVLRRSLDNAIVEFSKKWINSMGPSYLEEKLCNKGLKLDRLKSLISNRDLLQRHQGEGPAPRVHTPSSSYVDFKDKKGKGAEMSLKESDRAKEFKMFHQLLLNVVTFDPEIGHLLMLMDQICHCEASTIQVLKIKRE